MFLYGGNAVLGAGRWAHRAGGGLGNKVPLGGLENKERKMPKTKGRAWALTGLGHGLINWCDDVRFTPESGPFSSLAFMSANDP